MKKLKGLVLVLICATIGFSIYTTIGFSIDRIDDNNASYGTPESSAVVFSNLLATVVNRTIDINEHAIVTVQDTLEFHNNGSDPAGYIYYCYDSFSQNQISGVIAQNEWGSSLDIQETNMLINGYKTYIVSLNSPLLPDLNQKIIITTYYFDLIYNTPSFTGGETWYSAFSIFPFLPYEIEAISTTFTAPSGHIDTMDTIKTHIRTNIAPFSTETVNLRFDLENTPILEFIEIDRKIEVNSWGILSITEAHEIQNIGFSPVYNYVFTLPSDVTDVSAYDGLGAIAGVSLSLIINPDGKTKNVTMELLRDRSALGPFASFKYYLTYALPLDNYFSKGFTKNSFNLNLNLVKCEFLIRSQTITVQLYAGKSLLLSTITPKTMNFLDNSLELKFSDENTVSLASNLLYLEYVEDSFQLAIRPLMYTLLVSIFFAGYVLIRSYSKQKEKDTDEFREADIPEQELREFLNLYEEINALRITIQELENKLRSKKINKKLGIKQRKTLETKLKENQEEIRPFKRILIKSGDKITSAIRKLELKETELLANIDGILLHDQRYKTGKLPSKQAYNTLRAQMVKNNEKNQREIDKLINELKSFLI